jgi:hypothetical protein
VDGGSHEITLMRPRFGAKVLHQAFMTFSNAVLNFSMSSREPTVTRT